MTSRIYIVHGIVLKRRNVGEADRIVSIFTKEYGKIRVIAKGIRRITSRRAAHLEVFRNVTVTLHKGKTLDIVTEAQSAALFDTISSHVQKISFAYYLCELIDRLLPEHLPAGGHGQEHADIFRLAVDAFHSLDRGASALAWQQEIFTFALELLWILGYLPRTITLKEEHIQPYVERIIEKKLRTPKILHQLE